MKMRIFTLLALFSFVSFLGVESVRAQMPPTWPDELVGTWKVKREGNPAHYMVLNKNGTCKSTFNIDADGKWQFDVDQQEARINWSDGWTDILLKKGEGYESYGYLPNASAGDKPKNQFKATKVDLNPFDYLGIWNITDADGKVWRLTIHPDGTAVSNRAGEPKGVWEISGKKVHISWGEGGNDFLVKDKSGACKLEFNPPTVKGGKPSGFLRAQRTKIFLKGGVTASVI